MRPGSPPLAWISVRIRPGPHAVDPDALGRRPPAPGRSSSCRPRPSTRRSRCTRWRRRSRRRDDTLTMAPPLAAAPGRHAPDRLARAQEAADDVGRSTRSSARVHVLEAHLPVEHAGVVDERRDRAEARSTSEQAHDVRFEADVGRIASAVPPCARSRRRLLRRLGAFAVGDGDRIARAAASRAVAAPMPRLPPVMRMMGEDEVTLAF